MQTKKVINAQSSFGEGFILNVNKPIGKTSFSIVSYVRKLANVRKVGHAGTLDPLASGVLLVAVGKATKKVSSLMDMPKEYVGTAKFGVETDTYDAEGRVVANKDVGDLKEKDIIDVLPQFQGKVMQTPPIYSAIKHKGKPLYKYARQGIEIKPQPKEVVISSICIESFKSPEAVLRIRCSKGTYIRSLVHDIGQVLGCGAMLAGLVRESVGTYHVDDAINYESLPEEVDSLVN